ncbi:MAG: hypothetical protein CMJ78_06575 [Planctomycetaceae bacterium]|nr:hypothetical protein [Planctomycetaceae bacterium]
MSSIVPHRFLFRYSIAIPKMVPLPNAKGRLLDLADSCIVPSFGELDELQSFGEVRAAYNDDGLGFSVRVTGKSKPPIAGKNSADAVDVWIDTRNTQNIHRASKFCHWFNLLPRATGGQAGFLQRPVPRAREDSPTATSESVKVYSEIDKDGYLLEAWFSSEALHGFDPVASPKLGFYYRINDSELGEQFFGVDLEFPVTYDPSMWATLELS